MFLFRRNGAGNRARLRALRLVYWSFIKQNGPEARAWRLLWDWLSPEQRAQFDAEAISKSRALTRVDDIEFTRAA
ncbi:hypothetical protein ACVIN2_002794 [Bradyrhizobium sp. USDA 3650]